MTKCVKVCSRNNAVFKVNIALIHSTFIQQLSTQNKTHCFPIVVVSGVRREFKRFDIQRVIFRGPLNHFSCNTLLHFTEGVNVLSIDDFAQRVFVKLLFLCDVC